MYAHIKIAYRGGGGSKMAKMLRTYYMDAPVVGKNKTKFVQVEQMMKYSIRIRIPIK